MKTYTNPEHPEQGFDPRNKSQVKADREREGNGKEENNRGKSDFESDDNLDDGSGMTEKQAAEESMN